jgi:hypothetical protein
MPCPQAQTVMVTGIDEWQRCGGTQQRDDWIASRIGMERGPNPKYDHLRTRPVERRQPVTIICPAPSTTNMARFHAVFLHRSHAARSLASFLVTCSIPAHPATVLDSYGRITQNVNDSQLRRRPLSTNNRGSEALSGSRSTLHPRSTRFCFLQFHRPRSIDRNPCALFKSYLTKT